MTFSIQSLISENDPPSFSCPPSFLSSSPDVDKLKNENELNCSKPKEQEEREEESKPELKQTDRTENQMEVELGSPTSKNKSENEPSSHSRPDTTEQENTTIVKDEKQGKREGEGEENKQLPPVLPSLPTFPSVKDILPLPHPTSSLPPLLNLPAPIPKVALPSFSQLAAAASSGPRFSSPLPSLSLPGKNSSNTQGLGAFTPLQSTTPATPFNSPRHRPPPIEIPKPPMFQVPSSIPIPVPLPYLDEQVRMRSQFFSPVSSSSIVSALAHQKAQQPPVKVRKEITKKQREARQRNAAIAREVYRQKRLLGAQSGAVTPLTTKPRRHSLPENMVQLESETECGLSSVKRTPSPSSPISPLSPSSPFPTSPRSHGYLPSPAIAPFFFPHPAVLPPSYPSYSFAPPMSSGSLPISPQLLLSASPLSAYERNLAVRKMTAAMVKADLGK